MEDFSHDEGHAPQDVNLDLVLQALDELGITDDATLTPDALRQALPRILEKLGVDLPQIWFIVNAMEQSETEIITRSVFIVTLHEELDKFRKEFLGYFRELRDEIKETRNRAETRSDTLSQEIKETNQRIEDRFGTLSQEIKEANQRTEARFDAQSKEIKEIKEIVNKLPGMVWRALATVIGVLSALIGLLFLLFGG